MSLTGASGFHYAETAEDISRDLALDGAAFGVRRHVSKVPRTDSSTATTLDPTEGVIFAKNARPRPNRLAAERYAIG
jgi:hypothetical protein